MAVNSGGDKLQFYPQFVINFTEERSAAILCVMDNVTAVEQFLEFLLVKTHRSASQD